MYRQYDLFEKFPDGSSLWRASVLGSTGTRLHLQELARKSANQFYAIDLVSGKVLRARPVRVGLELLGSERTGRKSRAAGV